MSQILVGVFNSFEEADQAVMRLEQSGIARSDMEVHASSLAGDKTGTPASSGTLSATDRQAVSDRTITNDGEGVGVIAKIEHFFSNVFGGDERPEEVGHYKEAVRRGGALLTVTVVDEAHLVLVRSTLHKAGAVDIDERVAHWKNTGYAGYDTTMQPDTADEVSADRQAFSVVRESLDVGKREVQTGGVRVYSRATETPVTESVNLREEHATIERRPVDRVATAADLQGGSIEIRETAEHAVVAKTAHVIEEVVVGRESSERTETINETLRGNEVEVERVAGDKSSSKSTPGANVVSDGSTVVDPLKPL
ncbi:YsnF/AvaK domain-containing protein [Caballeronia sp. GAWG1-1]|uniref:YsnF/AvaK domain-containing protein n=1 Tax=Caballeronia sp. GAWG1-1 TaxID=2921742 RepID=UPI0020279FA8|nr:YsnF/AvaK domain-containing protein [Caballeronia sp. GAWG1-1]